MNFSRSILSIFALILAVLAPQAQAMNLFPKAKQVAKLAMASGRTAMASAAKKGITPATLPLSIKQVVAQPAATRGLFSNVPRASNTVSTAARAQSLALTNSHISSSSMPGVAPILARSMSTAADNSAGNAIDAANADMQEKIAKFFKNPFVPSIMQEFKALIEQDPAFEKACIEHIKKHGQEAKESWYYRSKDFIVYLMERNPDIVPELKDIVQQNFITLLWEGSGRADALVHAFLRHDPRYIEQLIIQKFPIVLQQQSSSKVRAIEGVIDDLLYENPESMVWLAKIIASYVNEPMKAHEMVWFTRMLFPDSFRANLTDMHTTKKIEAYQIVLEAAMQHIETVISTPRGVELLDICAKFNWNLPEATNATSVLIAGIINHINVFKKDPGLHFLDKLMGNNREVAKALGAYFENNIEQILNDGRYNGRFVRYVLDHNPEIIQSLTAYAIEHFGALSNKKTGRWFINELMQQNEEKADQLFMASAAKHFEALVKNEDGIAIIHDIADANPVAAQLFTAEAIKHMKTLADSSKGYHCLWRIMTYNPQAASLFAEAAVADFEALLHKQEGCHFMSRILENHPEAAQSFTPFAVTHFDTLVKNVWGICALDTILEKNPKAATLFTAGAAKNIHKMAIIDQGLMCIGRILSHDPHARTLFTASAAEHFEALIKAQCGYGILNGIMGNEISGKNEEAAQLFTSLATKHFDTLVRAELGPLILNAIVKKHPAAAQAFTADAVKYFDAFIHNKEGLQCLTDIVEHNPAAASLFMNKAAESFGIPMANHHEACALLIKIAQHNAAAAQLYISLAVDMLNKHQRFEYSVVSKIIQNNPSTFSCIPNQDLIKINEAYPDFMVSLFKNKITHKEVSKRIATLLQDDAISPSAKFLMKTMMVPNPTPTEKCLIDTYHNIYDECRSDIKQAKVSNLIDQVVEIERPLQEHHYTFEHGKQWPYQLPERVYRIFWSLANDKTVPPDFMFTHTKPFTYSPIQRAAEFQEELALHKLVINEHANTPGERRNRSLFMNTSLIGNINSNGSSSLYYVLKNYNQADARVSMKSIFEQFGLQTLYEKHKERCKALEKEAIALSNWGQLLVLGIPKDKINEFVTYLCISGRAKSKIKIGDEETYDVKQILDARLQDPNLANNDINWIAAMTDNALLNPDSGVKIKAIENPNDMAAFKAWEMKFNEFMQSISAEAKEIMDAHKKAAIEKDMQGK